MRKNRNLLIFREIINSFLKFPLIDFFSKIDMIQFFTKIRFYRLLTKIEIDLFSVELFTHFLTTSSIIIWTSFYSFSVH